jgi:hypothetical protein
MRKLLLTSISLLFWTAFAAASPREADLKPQFDKFGLEARLQGGRGACTLFAVTALADFEYARKMGGPPHPFSEEYLVWSTHDASNRKDDSAVIFRAVHFLNQLGICADQYMPYAGKKEDAITDPSAEARANAKLHAGRWKVHWIRRLDFKQRLTDNELRAIKKALIAGHPVAISMALPKKLKGASLLEVPAADAVGYGHSIALVGYSDNDKPGGGVLHFRNSWGPGWGTAGYGELSYAYARAYLYDAVWLEYGPEHSEQPLVRFEAETLPVLRKDQCDARSQDMKGFDGRLWSQGKQLFCVAKNGGWVELGFNVAKAGRYRLRALATAAPDYGKVRVALDGKTVGKLFDLYCDRVSPSDSLELGTVELTAGRHTLRFTAVDKREVSSNYFFGIDAIDLLAAPAAAKSGLVGFAEGQGVGFGI